MSGGVLDRRALLVGLGLGLGAGAARAARASPALRLRFPGGRDAQDRRHEAIEELLRLVLLAAGEAEPEIVRVPGLSQARRLLELQNGGLDVGFVSSLTPQLQELRVLRTPLRRGLLGLRLLLAYPDLVERLKPGQELQVLRASRLGYGNDWTDLPQMQTAGFQVVGGNGYSNLFRMFEQRRFDWMHRGLNEIWTEVDEPGLVPPQVVVVPRLALYFPLDDYFCVGRHRPELLPLLARGFEALRKSGGYSQWFRRSFGAALTRAALGKRQVLHLAGYGVPPDTPLQQFDALSLAPTHGELRLP